MNSELTDEKLAAHIGHNVVIATYGSPAVNIALECEDCFVLLADCDPPKDDQGNPPPNADSVLRIAQKLEGDNA